jgi:tRNA(fMet)-specific endonuclease VapC
MKTTALDTNVAIDLLNGNVEILLNYEKYTSLYLPVTVCGELFYGAINSNSSKKNLMKYRGFISNCTILNINSAIAEKYASIRKGLKDKGTPIPENDIWIAATCIVYEIPLATNDKHFSNIEDLKLT